MAHSDFPGILSAAVVWGVAYVLVAIFSSLRGLALICFCGSNDRRRCC